MKYLTYGWRFTIALIVSVACLTAPVHHLMAQAADSVAAVTSPVQDITAMAVLTYDVIGVAAYQLLKRLYEASIGKLPSGVHMTVLLVANVLYQSFAPVISAKIGYQLPAELSVLGPAAITGIAMTLSMMGTHKLWQHFRDWVKSKLGIDPSPATT